MGSAEMLATKCVGDMFKILMRVFAILVIKILNISLNITFGYQYSRDVNKIFILFPTSKNCDQL